MQHVSSQHVVGTMRVSCPSRTVFPVIASSTTTKPAPRLLVTTCNRALAVHGARPPRGLGVCAAAQQDPLDSPCPVPEDQQPVREYQLLQETLLFNWATMSVPGFVLRLFVVYGVFFVTLGLPISAVTFNMQTQPVECAVSASIGSLLIVSMVVIRLYLGWAHVGNRLLSATVEYEETGWYDGQVWVKDPSMLLRDRLLGINMVKPTLQRLRTTLVSLAGVIAGSSLLLAALPAPEAMGSSAGMMGSSGTTVPLSTASAFSAMQQGGGGGGMDDAEYWKRVECFEPWAVEGKVADRTAEQSLAAGMHAQGCKVAP